MPLHGDTCMLWMVSPVMQKVPISPLRSHDAKESLSTQRYFILQSLQWTGRTCAGILQTRSKEALVKSNQPT